MPPPDDPESENRPGTLSTSADEDARLVVIKPPLPSLSFSRSREESIDIKLPHVIAGALVAAFAAKVADGLDNDLLTHYYLSDQRVRINLDRVFDRLVAEFTSHIWDELWDFYYAANAQHTQQLSLLFQGPVQQMVLVLNGPELSACLLERLGPGLSRRSRTWTNESDGVDLSLALQLVCRWWHHEHPSRSPGGSPDEIARNIVNHLITGKAYAAFLAKIKRRLYSPHYVQMDLMDAAVWDMVIARPHRPPTAGYRAFQFRFECDPRQRIMDEGHVEISSFPAIIGTASQCLLTTVAGYVERHWPRCGQVVIRCLEEALKNATESFQHTQNFTGMSFWDDTEADAALSPGLSLVHVEIEEGLIRMSVSAWVLTLVEILQQMAWICAALSSSPAPEGISECALQVINWEYTSETTFVNCSMTHQAVPTSDGAPWLQNKGGAVVIPGFPVEEHMPQNSA